VALPSGKEKNPGRGGGLREPQDCRDFGDIEHKVVSTRRKKDEKSYHLDRQKGPAKRGRHRETGGHPTPIRFLGANSEGGGSQAFALSLRKEKKNLGKKASRGGGTRGCTGYQKSR